MHDRNSRFIIKPQVNISRSTAVRMLLLICCGVLAVLQSALSDSGASVGVAFAAVISAVITEFLITRKHHGIKKIKDGSAVVSGLILALMLPNYIHPVYAALGAAFAMIVIKYSFGGLGANWLNPALGGWLFVRISWPGAFSAALAGSPPPAEYLSNAGSAVDQWLGGFFNKFLFSSFGAELPPGYIDLFSMHSPGIIADRAVLAIIIGTVAVAAFMISRLWISGLYLFVFCFLVRLFGDLPAGGVFNNGDIIIALLSGGTLPAAFFLIVEPSAGAKSVYGSAVAAVIAAIFSFVFRYSGGELYGCFYAVALVNAFTPLLYMAERRWFYKLRIGASGEDSQVDSSGTPPSGGNG